MVVIFLQQVQLSEKTVAAEAAEALAKELDAKVEEQKKLITRLEEDILKVSTCEVA